MFIHSLEEIPYFPVCRILSYAQELPARLSLTKRALRSRPYVSHPKFYALRKQTGRVQNHPFSFSQAFGFGLQPSGSRVHFQLSPSMYTLSDMSRNKQRGGGLKMHAI